MRACQEVGLGLGTHCSEATAAELLLKAVLQEGQHVAPLGPPTHTPPQATARRCGRRRWAWCSPLPATRPLHGATPPRTWHTPRTRRSPGSAWPPACSRVGGLGRADGEGGQTAGLSGHSAQACLLQQRSSPAGLPTRPLLSPPSLCAVRQDDPAHGWLGASPDGLIESLALEADQGGTAAVGGLPPGAAAHVAAGRGPVAGAGRGILEIKCPFNKGQPGGAAPPQHATWYYMPQVGAGSVGMCMQEGPGAGRPCCAWRLPSVCPTLATVACQQLNTRTCHLPALLACPCRSRA